MKDNYGDKILIVTEDQDGDVYLELEDRELGARAGAELSPKKARKLAAKLVKAADEAEAL